MTELTTTEATIAGAWSKRRDTAAFVRGEGCWLFDETGERYLDMTSAYGVACLGHCHPAVTRAITEQAQSLIACPQNLYSAERARYFSALAAVLPESLRQIFPCNSGTEAIEAALKLARLASGRQGVVAVKGSFHGRTAGALSATWNPKTREPFEPLLGGVTFVNPNRTDELESAIGDDTSCFVTEVIQGESGVNLLDAEFLGSAQELCRERGALLVVDEIQTGIGRTGSWFAHTEVGLEPQIMTLAKGLGGGFPIGATCFTETIAESLFPGAHGSTFGGNPLACAAARATLETLSADGVIESAREKGEHFRALLTDRLAEVPLVREIRGRGLMIGVELRQRAGRVIAKLNDDHRVLALPAGLNVVRFLPPLVVDEDQMELTTEALARALAEE